jgi:hypothetical protein
MSIFSRTSLIIIAISAPVLAIGDPGYNYYPSYHAPYNPPKQNSPPDRGDSTGGAKVHLLEYKRPQADTPTQAAPAYAPPPYAPPVYGPPAAYKQPIYEQPAVPTPPTQNPPAIGDDLAPDQSEIDKLLYNPPIESTPSAQTSHNPPAGNIPAYIPEYTPTYNVPTPPKGGYGKPSPLPNSMDRRNAPRVARKKSGRNVKSTPPKEGHTRRFPFLKKRQHPGQHPVVPVTVNMISDASHASTTSGALTTTTANALAASPSPGIKVDTSIGGVSSPVATKPSLGASTAPMPSFWEGQHNAGGPTPHRNKAAVVASVLSIMAGLIVLILIVKLTSNALRKRKYPVGLGKYEEHSSKEGLIPDECDKVHFETHDVIVTCPDGSEISRLSPSRGDSPSPPPFAPHIMGSSLPPTPMPTFAPPPAPTSPLAMSYAKLLSPTANLARQSLNHRISATSETMSTSTTTTDISERRSTSDCEGIGRQLSHRRMRSAPGSVVWSARSSRATGKFTSGISGEEGYWDSVDVCGSESVNRMACRSSRGRSVAMSVMW